VLTHGWAVDSEGKAMHKSGGNAITPEGLIKNYGAEIIRLWVACEDYRDNIRLSEEILQRLTEAYRRIRNTCRFLLGNLSDFKVSQDQIPYDQMKELDQWVLHRLQELNTRVLKAYDDFEFHLIYHSLHNFCVLDLSAFYLDIIKDRLYASPPKSVARRSAQTALQEILEVLVRLMAPILSFTADEIWGYMNSEGRAANVHADLFWPIKAEYENPKLAEKWDFIVQVREEANKALEFARKEKRIGHALDALVTLGMRPDIKEKIKPFAEQLRTIFIVSMVKIVPIEELSNIPESELIKGLKVKVSPSQDTKCERCWIHEPSVGSNAKHPGICQRCANALQEMGI
jgi:isoleucyl-tRNA synthetase